MIYPIVGIVGSEAAKFTPSTERTARIVIRKLLSQEGVKAVCSGRCALGGIDIWAEEVADELGLDKIIYPPKVENWSQGYKPRNLQIARTSNIVNCITVSELPPDYTGMRFDGCYHCGAKNHVKSGGCWTMLQARKLGKPGTVYVISPTIAEIMTDNVALGLFDPITCMHF